jgi:hypothetical protein
MLNKAKSVPCTDPGILKFDSAPALHESAAVQSEFRHPGSAGNRPDRVRGGLLDTFAHPAKGSPGAE